MNSVKLYELPVLYKKLSRAERREVRLQYIEQQKGLCYHCLASLESEPAHDILEKAIDWSLFPPEFLKYPVHLHHSHDNGLTIGAVHAYCNAVLWQYHGE